MSLARKIFCFLIVHCALFIAHSSAEYIRVGIFTSLKSSEYIFIATNSDYLITGDHRKKLIIQKGESMSFQQSGNIVVGKYKEKVIGRFTQIKCASLDKGGSFRLKSTKPETSYMTFPDFLEATIYKGRLNMINVVDLEKYLCSVIEAEAGDNSNPEFLKVQAVLCRTFALGHLKRHLSQGYQVCDNVHCQVFPAKSRLNGSIEAAVEQTKGIVMIDEKSRLATAVFHSNCGGQTADAKDAWSTPVSCLKSVRDTFCLHAPHAEWGKTIEKKRWVSYLKSKNVVIEDSLQDTAFTLNQPTRQAKYLFPGNCATEGSTASIPLKNIRNDLKLRSTWFNMKPQGDSLFLQGYGYGHGVGLCQEGAMKMAEYGYKMKDIISFYYKGVTLVNYDTVKFLKGK